jgi:hypothetical protein
MSTIVFIEEPTGAWRSENSCGSSMTRAAPLTPTTERERRRRLLTTGLLTTDCQHLAAIDF